jgi:O-antigen/teichoic acid export membrane protein
MKLLSSSKHGNKGMLKASLLFMIFSIIIAALNYLYQLFMGRMLGPVKYGILGSLFAIVYIATYTSSPFNFVISKNVAEYNDKNQHLKIKGLFKKTLKDMIIFGFILLIVYILLTPKIAEFMNIDSYSEIIIVGVIAYISLISVIFIGTLNGLQKFVWQNLSGFVISLLKLTLAIFFVFIVFSVNGALGAILFGIIIGTFFAYIPLKKEFKDLDKEEISMKKIYFYAIPVFLGSILFILIITLDQILVKHFFSSESAGIYAAAGMIGKIILFSTSFLIGPFFPKVVSLKSRGKNTSNLLLKALFSVFIIVLLEGIIFFLFPEFILNLLYGKSFIGAVELIGIFGVSLGLFSLIQILMTYNLAVEKFGFIYIFIAGLIFEIIAIYLFHNTLMHIAKIVLLTNVFILLGCLIYNRKEVFNRR